MLTIHLLIQHTNNRTTVMQFPEFRVKLSISWVHTDLSLWCDSVLSGSIIYKPTRDSKSCCGSERILILFEQVAVSPAMS